MHCKLQWKAVQDVSFYHLNYWTIGIRELAHISFVASDQGLHCLITECSIKILINMKNP